MHLTTSLLLVLLIPLWFTQPLHALPADTSCGIIWDEPILLTDSTYTSISPKIALSGDDTLHVIWVEDIGHIHRLPYRRAINGVWEPIRDLIVDTIQFPVRMFENQIVTDHQNVYVFAQRGQDPHNRNVMSKSSDRGTTWTTQYIGIDTAANLYSANARMDTLVLHYRQTRNGVRVQYKLMYSTDGGDVWYHRPDSLRPNSRTTLTNSTLHLAQNIVVGSAAEVVYARSFDLGETWQDWETLSLVDGRFAYEMGMAALSNDSLNDVIIAWRDAIVCAAMVGCTVIERETHTNGVHWLGPQTLTEIPRGYDPSVSIGPTRIIAVSWTDEATLTQLHTVIRPRPNRDSPWCPIVNLSPTSSNVGGSCVVVGARAIHVVWSEHFPGEPNGSFRIVYRRGRFIDTEVKEQPVTPPPYATLQQNYPNPFNPNTTITFSVGTYSYTSLRVYDLLGREVAILVNEKKEPGEHTVEWNAEGLPSGVYYYRLIAGDRIETRKAALIK